MEEKLDELVECERVIRQLSGRRLRLMAELRVDEWAEVDIGLALQLSPTAARWEINRACELVADFPNVVDALEAGVIDERRAHGMVEPVNGYSASLAQDVIAKVLETAGSRSVQQLRRSVRDRLQRADPAEHARRREKRCRDRAVKIYDQDDSMATLVTEQPAEIAHAMYTKIDRLAQRETKNGRTIDQVRADVHAALVLEEPQAGGVKPLIQVTVPVTALLGVSDRPGVLEGGQLIPAGVVRDLMAHPGTVFHRLLTDAAGHLVEYSPEVYRPRVGVDRFVRAKYRSCMMPCCSHPSRSCDLDHVTAWPVGKTEEHNLGPFDRHHHRYKHATKAEVTIGEDGTTTMKTRWGKTYVTKPLPIDPPF